MANAAFVSERLAVGGDLSPNFGLARRQLEELVAAGITHIADLREEWSDETLVKTWAPQVHYLHHRVADAGQAIGGVWFEELADWVDAALTVPGSKVLVHCHMGVNRAPSAVLALLLHGGMGLRPALDAIRTARPVAVIDYARSALDWHLDRTAADARVRRNARRTLDRWRRANHLDAIAVIRAIRDTEHPGNRWFVRLGPGDPDALADVLEPDGNVAVALAVDLDPEVLGQLDEVLFLTGGRPCRACAGRRSDAAGGAALVAAPRSGHRPVPARARPAGRRRRAVAGRGRSEPPADGAGGFPATHRAA